MNKLNEKLSFNLLGDTANWSHAINNSGEKREKGKYTEAARTKTPSHYVYSYKGIMIYCQLGVLD